MISTDRYLKYLYELFPEAVCELNFGSTFELLVAVILSAQCTDKRVNMVTAKLFQECNTPEGFCKMPLEVLEEKIKSCGFYHNKAKHIKQASEAIVKNFAGEVPKTFDELVTLAGVGRKTANVVCSVAYGENRCAVDTHVLRVSNRLGFANTSNPDVCERELTNLFKTNLDTLHYRTVLFGRYYCKAIKPECETCELKKECLFKLGSAKF